MNHSHRLFLVALLPLSMALGCAKNSPDAESPGTSGEVGQEDPTGKDPGKSAVKISKQIRDACGISESEAYFAYNSSSVSAQADGLLEKLANCFQTGPLAGERMALIGHADPRGDEEYNMVLGGKRSDALGQAIAGKGLDSSKIQTTSRGELDAHGTDESSWARDRRVDIEVAQ